MIDHIIIAVSDLPKATQDYALMLGRTPSWCGTHPAYGTANSLFRLDNIYLELLAVDDATSDSIIGERVRAHIAAHGESLMGLIFGTDDANAFATHAAAQGLALSAPQAGSGVDTQSGETRQWRNLFWQETSARGIFSFMIEHEDAEALPPAAISATEIGKRGHITAIDHVVVQTSNAAAAKKFYGDQLGIRLALEQSRPQWGGEMLFFRSNAMSIEVIAAEKYDAEKDALWGLALKTADIAASVARLAAAGIGVSAVREGRKANTQVATLKSHCCDVPTLLIQHN